MSDQGEFDPINYDELMQANLKRVFGEHDAKQRIKAIHELYLENAVLYEPQSSVMGHDAISEAVTTVLDSLPPNFVFTAVGPALGHHGIGRLRWNAGPPKGPVVVSGMDVAHFEEGRISSLHVFIEPAGN
jgi:SnoaL-like domain